MTCASDGTKHIQINVSNLLLVVAMAFLTHLQLSLDLHTIKHVLPKKSINVPIIISLLLMVLLNYGMVLIDTNGR